MKFSFNKHVFLNGKRIVIIISCLFFLIYCGSAWEAFSQTKENARDASVSVKNITENKDETNEPAGTGSADKAATGEGETPEGDNAYLSEAGKFSVRNFDPTVWVLVFLFNLALAVSIERTWYLFRNRGNNAKLLDMLTSGLGKDPGNYKNITEQARAKKYGIEGRVASKTLEGWQFGRNTMTEFSKAAISAESRGLDKRLVVLSTLGNNTPFIGLLGTVLGIMKAFRDLALAGDAGPAVVMKGISEALIATACGLAVAIPCVITFNMFSKMVKNRLSNAQEIVDILIGIKSAFEMEGTDGIKDIVDGKDPSGDYEREEDSGSRIRKSNEILSSETA